MAPLLGVDSQTYSLTWNIIAVSILNRITFLVVLPLHYSGIIGDRLLPYDIY